MEALADRLGAPTAKQLHIAAMREGLSLSLKEARAFVAKKGEQQIFRPPPASKAVTATRDASADAQADLIDLKQLPSGPFKYILFYINVLTEPCIG